MDLRDEIKSNIIHGRVFAKIMMDCYNEGKSYQETIKEISEYQVMIIEMDLRQHVKVELSKFKEYLKKNPNGSS